MKNMTQTEQHNLKVLIADDEIEFASTLVARLKLRSFQASMVNSGKAALAAIEVEQPDVLILDLKMPDLDGLEVLASLNENYPDLAVIILTGHGSFEAGRQGMELGAYDYIMKPVRYETLLDKIEEHLNLTWEYKKDPVGDTLLDSPKIIQYSPQEKNAKTVLTNRHILNRKRLLIEMAEVGYAKGLHKLLVEIANEEGTHDEFQILENMLNTFQFQKIVQILKES